MPKLKPILVNGAIVLIALVLSLGLAEGVLRLKNAAMTNYDIEMWRYARLLKRRVADPRIGHEHIPDAHAVLQSVLIRTDSWGLRGGPIQRTPAPGTRRILVLGDSLALGWGVAESQTLSADLQRQFIAAGQKVEILNGGVGDYNTQRIVEHFLARLTPLHPTDILYLASFASAEILHDTPGNFLMRHSELAVMSWVAIENLIHENQGGARAMAESFQRLYQPGSPGLAVMKAELARLARYCSTHGIRVTVAVMPDIRDLPDHPPTAIEATITAAARSVGFTTIDLLPLFRHDQYRDLRIMPGDYHFNAATHARIAAALYPILAGETQSAAAGR